MPKGLLRIEAVKTIRAEGLDEQPDKAAIRPSVFQAKKQNVNGNYLAIPRVSSEQRKYIPIAYLKDRTAGDKLKLV